METIRTETCPHIENQITKYVITKNILIKNTATKYAEAPAAALLYKIRFKRDTV